MTSGNLKVLNNDNVVKASLGSRTLLIEIYTIKRINAINGGTKKTSCRHIDLINVVCLMVFISSFLILFMF